MHASRWILLRSIMAAAALVPLFVAALPARAADPLAGLSDDFSNSATLSTWKILSQVEGTPQPYNRLDIGKTRPGYLTVVPNVSVWYMNETGTMLFKTVRGDFMVTASVDTHTVGDPATPPRNPYNSAGLVARDPGSHSGSQNWIVCNVGMQDSSTGSEVKTTRNSVSQLHLEGGAEDGQVRMARRGDTFTMLRKLRGESTWRVIGTYRRPEMPAALQVGIMCNGYQTADLAAHFDFVRFATPRSAGDLTR
jgi:regulation of enolase protein 1 (concanavalin A-like superfamily)